MKYVKTTIIGGLVFMVPVVIVVAIVGKALELMKLMAKPLGSLLPIETFGGIVMANILAVLGLVLLCFAAGLIARSTLAKNVYRSLDRALFAMPGYAFVRGFTDSMTSGEEAAKGLLPVLVRFDDNEQIGFEVERLEQGNVVVYRPGAPDPWSAPVNTGRFAQG